MSEEKKGKVQKVKKMEEKAGKQLNKKLKTSCRWKRAWRNRKSLSAARRREDIRTSKYNYIIIKAAENKKICSL